MIINNELGVNRLRGRSMNSWWNCVRADLNKCKIFDWRRSRMAETAGRGSIEEAKIIEYNTILINVSFICLHLRTVSIFMDLSQIVSLNEMR